MKIYLVILLSTVAYSMAARLALMPKKPTEQTAQALPIIPAASFGLLCHVFTLFHVRHDIEQFGIMAMMSLMGLLITTVSLAQHALNKYRLPIGIVTAFSAIIVWLPYLIPEHAMHSINNDGSRLHIVLAMAAYVSLGFSGLYALLTLIQTNRLKRHVGLSQPETPLTELEKLMMRAAAFAMGFLLLSFAVSVWLITDKLTLRHQYKLFMGVAVWLPIAALLTRHYLYGFRGQKAALWILGGTVVAFFGYLITGFMR